MSAKCPHDQEIWRILAVTWLTINILWFERMGGKWNNLWEKGFSRWILIAQWNTPSVRGDKRLNQTFYYLSLELFWFNNISAVPSCMSLCGTICLDVSIGWGEDAIKHESDLYVMPIALHEKTYFNLRCFEHWDGFPLKFLRYVEKGLKGNLSDMKTWLLMYCLWHGRWRRNLARITMTCYSRVQGEFFRGRWWLILTVLILLEWVG